MTECKSMGQLQDALMKQIRAAAQETVEESYVDLQRNVEQFYFSAGGQYHRTGQLKKSPQIDFLRQDGNKVEAQISLDTSEEYHPSGRDTETIYSFAENGLLIGNGGFWKKTVSDMDEIVHQVFSKHFQSK